MAILILWILVVIAALTAVFAFMLGKRAFGVQWRTTGSVSAKKLVQARRDWKTQNQSRQLKQADAQRRRDDARLRCLMLYDQHSTALEGRFPRERLHEYFEQYMADSLEPEVVEERAQTLGSLIDECLAQEKPRQRNEFQSLAELAAFFQTQREETTQLPYDDEVKESLLTNINIQEEQTIRRFLSS